MQSLKIYNKEYTASSLQRNWEAMMYSHLRALGAEPVLGVVSQKKCSKRELISSSKRAAASWGYGLLAKDGADTISLQRGAYCTPCNIL